MNIREITGNSNTPIVIVQEPENSKVTDNGDGTLTIIFEKYEEDKFFAPALVFVYKDENGELQEAKKEFVVTQEGDVPSLIQTGYQNLNTQNSINWQIGGFIFALLFAIRLTMRRRKESL